MEDRSSRRVRTLVTRMARRGLSANEIACALISMMARSTCSNQRPDTLMQDRICQVDETSCNARPDHTHSGQNRKSLVGANVFRLAPKNGHVRRWRRRGLGVSVVYPRAAGCDGPIGCCFRSNVLAQTTILQGTLSLPKPVR